MKQLITRVDENLHRRLKSRAAAEGRSVNAVVTELLEEGLTGTDEQARLDAYLERTGRRYIPPAPKGPVSSHDEIAAMLRGSGQAIIDALEDDRNHR